ncbi:MAG: hypothetical protein IJT83_03305 [Victivallales bacterium]|nr:hypothetical protein [Victivallales bacterium]
MMAKLSFPFILIAFLALAQAVVAQKTVPVTRHVPPFELSREYQRKEAIAKTSLLLAKLRYDIASSSIEPMVQAIDKWLLEPSLAPETKHLLQFVSQEVLPSLAEAKTTIISNEKALVGLKLKGRNQTVSVLSPWMLTVSNLPRPPAKVRWTGPSHGMVSIAKASLYHFAIICLNEHLPR